MALDPVNWKTVYLIGAMARRPFNPDEAPGDLFNQPEDTSAPAKPERPQALTPSLLNKRIKQTLENNIGESLLLEGELTSFVNRGHWYFSVKDETAAIGCVMWRSDADRCGFEPVNGEAILLRGRVSYYTRDGRTQFYATAMQRTMCAESLLSCGLCFPLMVSVFWSRKK